MNESALDPWVGFFIQVIKKQLPTELTSQTQSAEEIERRDKHPLWKMKGIAMHVLYRIFSKYANEKFCDEADKPFSALILNRYAQNILNTALEVIFSRKE